MERSSDRESMGNGHGLLPRLVTGALIYVLLLALWPFASAPYAAFVRFGARELFGRLGAERRVEVLPLEEGMVKDTLLVIRSAEHPENVAGTGVSTEHLAYRPASVLVALVLASSLRWKRRVGTLVVGLVAVHAFVALRIGTILAIAFSRFVVDGEPLLNLRGVPDSVLETLGILLWQEPTVNYVCPVLLWAVIALPGVLRNAKRARSAGG